MVLPIIIGIAVIGLLITFREQIKDIIDDITKDKTPEEVDRQKTIDDRGALANTRAFIFGEGVFDEAKENQLKVEKFIKDSQTNIDLIATGINQTLVGAQQNLEKFAQESQTNIANTVNQFSQDVNKNVSGFGESIDQFFIDSKLNLDNFFGGQAKPKPITKDILAVTRPVRAPTTNLPVDRPRPTRSTFVKGDLDKVRFGIPKTITKEGKPFTAPKVVAIGEKPPNVKAKPDILPKPDDLEIQVALDKEKTTRNTRSTRFS